MARYKFIDPEELTTDPFNQEQSGESEFQSLLANETTWATTKRYKVGESIKGKVLTVGKEYIFVDLGGKNAGSISVDEFKNECMQLPKVGDELTLFVRTDNGSEVLLTRSLRRNEADDVMLREAYEKQIPIEVKVEKVIKGGFEGSIGAKRCFIPMGGMEISQITNPEIYVNTVLKFMIMEYNKGGRNIVVSRRSILKEEQEMRKTQAISTLEIGQMHIGTVSRIAQFGAFVDLNGVEGLVPLSELAWKRVKSVEEIVKVGDKVNVKVLKIEHTPRLKIALSLKDAGEDPWVSSATRLVPGEQLQGTVTNITDFGAFVSVNDGIEGLVPMSQFTWEKRIKHASEIVKIGESVNVHVISVDVEGRKLSLSIKGPMPEEIMRKFKSKGSRQESLTPEEIEQQKEWENWQVNLKQNPVFNAKQEDKSALAAAFKTARKRK